jgi:hypothetical protein
VPARVGTSRAPLPCFDLINKGMCMRGESCRFSHDADVLERDQRRGQGGEWAGARSQRRTGTAGSESPGRRRSRSRRFASVPLTVSTPALHRRAGVHLSP